MDLLDLLVVQRTVKSLIEHHSSEPSILHYSPFFMFQRSHPYMTTGKIIALIILNFFSKVMSLLLKNLYRFVSFSSNEQASFNFMAAVIICSDFGAPKHKVSHCFHCFPIYLPWSDGTKCHDLHFLNMKFKPDVSLSSFTFIKRLFSFSSHSAMRVVSSAYLRLLIFLPATIIPACPSSSSTFRMMYSA